MRHVCGTGQGSEAWVTGTHLCCSLHYLPSAASLACLPPIVFAVGVQVGIGRQLKEFLNIPENVKIGFMAHVRHLELDRSLLGPAWAAMVGLCVLFLVGSGWPWIRHEVKYCVSLVGYGCRALWGRCAGSRGAKLSSRHAMRLG
jgi:hypothetical protein